MSLALSLALPMDGTKFTGDWRMDVNPVFGVPAPTSKWGAAATTIPGAVLYDPRYAGSGQDMYSNPHVMRHELAHTEQQAALGPAFWAAYGATGGRAFEPYNPTEFFGPNVPEGGGRPGSGPDFHDMGRTWMPEDDERQRYPLFRLERQGDTSRMQVLPGYPELGKLTVKR
ncbi:MAG: hypothetical protein ACQERF_09020 [Actinomycetota bacterium]